MTNSKKLLKNTSVKALSVLLLAILLLIYMGPFVWALSTSLKASNEINAYPPRFVGSEVTFTHYNTVLGSSFTTYLRNSVVYSAIAIVVCAVFSTIYAYAFTRYRFRGRKFLFFLIIFGIPLSMGSAALAVPNYLLFSKMGLANKWFTLPLIYIAYNLPMSCSIMVGAMEAIPKSIEEAAAIDGASKFYIIGRLIPRLCMPTIACSSLLTFIGAWNEYTVSSVLVSSSDLYPVQVGIYSYLGYFGIEWGPLMASALLAVIPMLIVFTFLGRLLVSGMTAGAVKE